MEKGLAELLRRRLESAPTEAKQVLGSEDNWRAIHQLADLTQNRSCSSAG